jgi:hypothetical protein
MKYIVKFCVITYITLSVMTLSGDGVNTSYKDCKHRLVFDSLKEAQAYADTLKNFKRYSDIKIDSFSNEQYEYELNKGSILPVMNILYRH